MAVDKQSGALFRPPGDYRFSNDPGQEIPQSNSNGNSKSFVASCGKS
jgi:hypothetical protein